MAGRKSVNSIAAVALLALGLGVAAPALAAPGVSTQQGSGGAKNVVVFLGDGMGEAQRNAGQLLTVGAYDSLVMDTLPYAGEMGTDSVDPATFITDSAAAATSLASGIKTVNGAVGVDATGQALIAVGGGFGTLSEIALGLRLGRPVVLLGGWAPSLTTSEARSIIERHGPPPLVATTPTEAVDRALAALAGR